MVNLIDRPESRLIILGCQIDLNQIIVNLIGIFGTWEIIQEILKNRHGLTKSGKGRLVDQQGIIIHSRFLNHLIIRRGSRDLKGHTGIILIIQFQVALSQIKISVLRQLIVLMNSLSQGFHRVPVISLIVITNTQDIKISP